MNPDELMIFSGSASRRFTAKVCSYLGTNMRKSETLVFSDGNTFVRVLENVRGRDVFIIQTVTHKSNDFFMELLFYIDAFKRASANSVTVVVPYFGYGKGDKKDEPRVSIRAKVCADAIEAAGAERVVTMDLHAPQIQGFFRIPVDNLYGHPTLCDRLKGMLDGDLVVVAPDTGFADESRQFADYLGCPVAIGDKQRTGHDEKAHVLDIIGNVKGRTAVIVDDFIVSGGTLVDVARRLSEKGAVRILATASHGVFSKGSMAQLDESPIEKVVVTDTIETHTEIFSSKIEVESAAACFGEAIKRIHLRESISAMFP